MILGLGLALVGTTVLFVVVVVARGYDFDETLADQLTLGDQAIAQAGLWLGLLGMPIWAARTKGAGVVADFRLSQRWWDIPLGLGVGLVTQLLLVPLLYVPISRIVDTEDVGEPARELVDQARDETTVSVLLLVLVVVVGAPIIEELFFRGLLYRSLQKTWNVGVAVVGSALVFGLFHFQLLQLPALVLFGLVAAGLVAWTDRLGPAIWAHVSFNGITVFVLLCDCVDTGGS